MFVINVLFAICLISHIHVQSFASKNEPIGYPQSTYCFLTKPRFKGFHYEVGPNGKWKTSHVLLSPTSSVSLIFLNVA